MKKKKKKTDLIPIITKMANTESDNRPWLM